MKDSDVLALIGNMLADATEWTIKDGDTDGYWRGVAYMIESVIEHFGGQ